MEIFLIGLNRIINLNFSIKIFYESLKGQSSSLSQKTQQGIIK